MAAMLPAPQNHGRKWQQDYKFDTRKGSERAEETREIELQHRGADHLATRSEKEGGRGIFFQKIKELINKILLLQVAENLLH
jgi:hypothetical protein